MIVDHIAKILGVKDFSDYSQVTPAMNKLQHLAREFDEVHLLLLAHNKKTTQEDVFDQLLGSTAMRGATDANFMIYQENGKRVFDSEIRVGRAIERMALHAELVEVGGANVVSGFSLGLSMAEIAATETQTKTSTRERRDRLAVIAHLEAIDGQSAPKMAIYSGVGGKTTNIQQALDSLEREGIVRVVTEGKSQMVSLTTDTAVLKLARMSGGAPMLQ